MDGENGGEGSVSRRDMLKRLFVLGSLSAVPYHVLKSEYTPSPDEIHAKEMLNDEKAWEQRDGVFVAGEGEVVSSDGAKADYSIATDHISTYLISLALRDGVEDELNAYLDQNPLYIFLDRPESVAKHEWEMMDSSPLASFLPSKDKSLVVIYKLFFDLYDQTDRKSELVDMVFTHELHHLFQFVKGEARKMQRNTELLDDAANGSGFAVGHEVGGLGASNPVTTRRAFFKGIIGTIGMTVMGSISRRFLGGTNAPIERDAYSETDKLTQSDFFEPYKGKFLKVTEV